VPFDDNTEAYRRTARSASIPSNRSNLESGSQPEQTN